VIRHPRILPQKSLENLGGPGGALKDAGHLPSPAVVWQRYLRRFALKHWYRFLKQRLHWTVPKLGEPKAAERWSDLMLLATWPLWLARDLVQDSPLPWQKTLGRLPL
jgi:hypothetical protein